MGPAACQIRLANPVRSCDRFRATDLRNDLDHLPQTKQRELAHVVRVLFEEFVEITARTTDPKRKAARILKLVLFGSSARGDWVDDPVGGYYSAMFPIDIAKSAPSAQGTPMYHAS